MVRIIFCIEILVFILICCFGTHGLKRLYQLEQENEKIIIHIKQQEEELEKLRATIIAWEENPFFKEKIAREKLHMARAGEQVYYIK
jgi:cell division protein FtsB